LLNQLNERLKSYPSLAAALLFLITFSVFSGTFKNGFVYDDVPQVLENPFVLNPHLWKQNLTTSVWGFAGAKTNFYRPLQFLSYWLICRAAGPNPPAFHFFQLLLYAATVWLVYQLGQGLFEDELAAFTGALLWAVHPLHVEAVAWISALADAGCGFFYVLAFWLFLRAEKASNGRLLVHGLAAGAFFLALFFKEMAISFPLVVLAYWCLAAERPAADGWRNRFARWLPYLAAAVAYVAIRRAVLGFLVESRQAWKVPWKMAGAIVGLLGEHLRLFLWPAHMNLFRGFELRASLHSPWPWLTLLALVTMCWVRKREPRLSFSGAWWVVTLLPCLDVRQLSTTVVAERFSYIPSVGLCLAVSFLLLVALRKFVPGARSLPVALPALALVTILWSIQTIRAVPNWRDNDTLVNYSSKLSPNDAQLHFAKALNLQYRQGDLDAALREYELARSLDTRGSKGGGFTYYYYLGLGQIAQRKGRLEEAVDYFQKATRATRDNSQAFDALGSVYFPRGDYAKAAEYFEKAIKSNPYDVGARFYLGTCWMKLGKYRAAAEQFRTAAEIDPTYLQAYEAEARALEAAGDSAGAARARSRTPAR
jgi:tetratricopeptide (TPR) repeat protein